MLQRSECLPKRRKTNEKSSWKKEIIRHSPVSEFISLNAVPGVGGWFHKALCLIHRKGKTVLWNTLVKFLLWTGYWESLLSWKRLSASTRSFFLEHNADLILSSALCFINFVCHRCGTCGGKGAGKWTIPRPVGIWLCSAILLFAPEVIGYGLALGKYLELQC